MTRGGGVDYSGAMETRKTASGPASEQVLRNLETDLGEPILYRASGRFLGAEGLGPVPLDSWGLILLTPTRVVFRHFAQAHPLFGGKGEEIRWEVARDRFTDCATIAQSFWTKLFSGVPDHVGLTGPSARLALETADDQRKFPAAWS